MAFVYMQFFSDFMCFGMSLLLLTATLRRYLISIVYCLFFHLYSASNLSTGQEKEWKTRTHMTNVTTGSGGVGKGKMSIHTLSIKKKHIIKFWVLGPLLDLFQSLLNLAQTFINS